MQFNNLNDLLMTNTKHPGVLVGRSGVYSLFPWQCMITVDRDYYVPSHVFRESFWLERRVNPEFRECFYLPAVWRC